MPNFTAPAPKSATPGVKASAKPRKANAARKPAPALPEPLDAFDYLERIGDIAIHWWSVIENVFEFQSSNTGKADPVPQWALDILKDQGRHDATEREFSRQRDGLRELLRLAEGRYSYCYEVWARQSTRLSIRFESVADAVPTRDQWRENGYPDAQIIKVHRRNNCTTANGLAMLDTLIGRIWFAGVTLARGQDDENVLQIMDETGRTVEIIASELRGHPVIDRVKDGGNKQSLLHWIYHEKRVATEKPGSES